MNYTGHGIPNGCKDIVDDEVADLDYQSNRRYEWSPVAFYPGRRVDNVAEEKLTSGHRHTTWRVVAN
jgi:hypothetical protein